MQTSLADSIKDTPQGRRADSILRKCVHCGFCNATCPTYQLLGDELDGPRGRIYLVKQLLEGNKSGAATRLHLDRCLMCRACETTCPSGVEYGALLEIGRNLIDQAPSPTAIAATPSLRRPLPERLFRALLLQILPHRRRFALLLAAARIIAPLLPPTLRARVPRRRPPKHPHWPPPRHQRRMIALNGCIQPATAPSIDAAAARLLDHHDISLTPAPAGCCGALALHLGDHKRGLATVRRNIDHWWPLLEQGTEAIVVSASGCAVTIKEYGTLLANDPQYSHKAQTISAHTRDLSEVVTTLPLQPTSTPQKVAFHSPCTLQHGQKLNGIVEEILTRTGFTLSKINNPHLCCGSAGAWSLLHPHLSRRLLHDKLQALQNDTPTHITTANIGCLLHLQSGTNTRLLHWVELLAPN